MKAQASIAIETRDVGAMPAPPCDIRPKGEGDAGVAPTAHPAGPKASIGSLVAQPRVAAAVVSITACCLLPTAYCLAQPTQEQFFQSLQKSTDGSAMGVWQFLGVLAAAIGLIVLLVRFGQRATVPQARPQAVNHPRRLLREVRRTVPLRPAEWRQVKTLTDEQSLQSPLTLLLCPSLLERAGKGTGTKADPRLVARMVKMLRAGRRTNEG